jgi:hypothetical protein
MRLASACTQHCSSPSLVVPGEALSVASGSESCGPSGRPQLCPSKERRRPIGWIRPTVGWDVDGQRESGRNRLLGKVVVVAVVKIRRNLPVGLQSRGRRIRLRRSRASESRVVVRVVPVNDSLERVTERVCKSKNVVARRGQNRDLVNPIGGVAVLSGETIVVDGTGHQQRATDMKVAVQAGDGLQHDSGAQGVRGKREADDTGKVGVDKSSEQLAGVDGLAAFDNVIDEDGNDAVARPEHADWNSAPDLQGVEPVCKVGDAVPLIDLEAVSGTKNLAAVDSAKQILLEIAGIARPVCIKDLNRCDGTAN